MGATKLNAAGGVSKRTTDRGCKPRGFRLQRFESSLPHLLVAPNQADEPRAKARPAGLRPDQPEASGHDSAATVLRGPFGASRSLRSAGRTPLPHLTPGGWSSHPGRNRSSGESCRGPAEPTEALSRPLNCRSARIQTMPCVHSATPSAAAASPPPARGRAGSPRSPPQRREPVGPRRTVPRPRGRARHMHR